MSFSVRADQGTVAAISGSTLAGKLETKSVGQRQIESMTLSPEKDFIAAVLVENGYWTYKPANGPSLRSTVKADTSWHDVVVSHYTARGETLFFVDGTLAGTTTERLQPNRFVLGGPGGIAGAATPEAPRQADYRDFFLFRAALNADEAAALHTGKMLQASLEIYAPLADAQFLANSTLENRAQSLSMFKLEVGRVAHVARD